MKNTALITGASGGIGRDLALEHAKKTGDLVIVARSGDTLNQLKKHIETEYKREVLVIVADLLEHDAAKKLYDEINLQGIQIDYLINNAGFGWFGLFQDQERENINNMIQLNISVLTELTRYFLTDMLKRNSGKILQVSSTASSTPGPLQAVYFATKSYVQFFSNALSKELENTNITVTNLMPGPTATNFGKESGLANKQLFKNAASSQQVAADGYDAMLKGKLDIISGVSMTQKILLALVPVLPKKMALNIMYDMQQK